MIYLRKGHTDEIIVTLTEKQTLSAPNYLFYFKQRSSNDLVKFVLLNAADISAHKERYNKFSINGVTHFASELAGEWEYMIYEQTSTTNLDPALATSLLETGIMRLSDTDSFNFTEYSTNNTFIVR
jgi:hypothetical protein